MGKDLGIFATWPTIRSLVIANGLMGWHKMLSLSMRICLLGACRDSCEDLPKLNLLSRARTFGEATRVRKIDSMGEIPRESRLAAISDIQKWLTGELEFKILTIHICAFTKTQMTTPLSCAATIIATFNQQFLLA